ncbi:hypothetical protein C8F04DRAFT_1236291 [Mycena alexandri]|uniref:FAD-binding domain-containing protein n=1 Tax=Mycena alexandri TaxID=1745969 RepID=A0AAD6SRB2_9AGAR|nr:hypothetical protein C8F04DRAFT_1236291 [Mycena alexandri]
MPSLNIVHTTVLQRSPLNFSRSQDAHLLSQPTMSPAPPADPHRPMRFIVVGGSVAGLCAAYTLRQSGHDVVVLDKRDERVQTRGGIRVPPNMTRLLETLPGMKTLLRDYGTECEGMTFLEGPTSQIIGRMVFLDETMADLGCNFYMVPYDILLKQLLHLCRQIGVQLKFRTEVASVNVAFGQRPSVVTIWGDRIEGDLLIGADGRDSIIRDTLTQQMEDSDDDDNDMDSLSEREHSAGVSEIVGASYSIDTSRFRNSPELQELFDSDEFTVWPGSHVLATGHKCGPELYIVTITRVTGATPTDIDSDWHPNTSFPNADALVAEFEPRVKLLLSLASHCHQTIQRIPVVRKITHAPTSMVLIGDAAHTITIGATHNSSIAVEDGFALGRIFSHLTARDQIPYLLHGYREVRLARSMATEASELGAFIVITFPPGPARDARNEQLGYSLINPDDMPDELLALTWANYLVQFNYDANEAVDEWWLMAKFNMPHCSGNGHTNGHSSQSSEYE